ncbi:MAG: hypothetical protein HYY45_10900 [Deltaproteobacteria bacterium]|nr:hypothetical protein [Deltaproteobacteria bacterium]
MALNSKYRFFRKGRWDLWVRTEGWNEGLWEEILRQLTDQAPMRHPQTKRFYYPQGEKGEEFYLKAYYCFHLAGTIKDLFRYSKAFRALKQGVALTEQGFHVPLAVAAGEERDLGLLKKAFLLTARVEGSPLPLFLRDRFVGPLGVAALREKRDYLKRLALEIRHLHQAGFVHGDLVPSNILFRKEERGVTIFYMDNDRTRRYPLWLPQNLWKRNLVQLNRFVLPGISLQDRMRFLKSYLGGKTLGGKDRRLVGWLEKKTRKRRRECDRITAPVSFRELMRWNGPFTRNIQ